MNDDLSPAARTLFDAARASFSPDPMRIAAVRAAIGARLASPAPQGSEGSLPADAGIAATGSLGPYAVVLGLLAAVSVAGVIAWRHQAATPSGASAVAAPMAAAPAPVGHGGPVVPDLRVASPAIEPPAAAPAPPTVNAEQLPAVGPSAPSSGPARAGLRPHAAKREAASGVGSFGLRPQDDSNGGAVESPAPSAPPRAEPEDSLAREVSLLRAARAALDGGDAARALALLARHAQLWPGGVLAEERIATQVLALCALGRVADARAAARDLETVAPESPHLARVRASCVRGPGSAGP